MNTKKCSKCGWEYPGDWPGMTCRFCHTRLTAGYCVVCGEWSDKLHNNQCRKCETAQHAEWRDRQRNKWGDAYKLWMTLIRRIPEPYKTLTEDDWLKACSHFGGCAYCGSPEIDARSMFIPFKGGGRYCAWNILPACEQCETLIKLQPNPFLRMNDTYNRSPEAQARKYGYTQEKLHKILEYLQGRLT